MSISLDRLTSLDSGKSYYIANSTGDIKEAGFWQRFKCALNIGDGRTKAARLVEAVKNSLLESAGAKSNAALEQSLNGIDTSSSPTGAALSTIARSFEAANSKAIALTTAKKMADVQISATLSGLGKVVDKLHKPVVRSMMHEVVKGVVANPPLLANGKIDEIGLYTAFEKRLSAIEGILAELASKGSPMPDKSFAKHIVETLFSADGMPNGKSVSELKSRTEVIEAAARARGRHAFHHNDEAATLALMRFALGECGDDPDVLEGVIWSMERLLVRGDDQLRTQEQIKAKIDGIKANIAEAREAAKDNGEIYEVLCEFIHSISVSRALDPGSIKMMVDIVENAPMPKFADARGKPRESQIHAMLREVCDLEGEFLNKTGLLTKYSGGDEHGAARGTFFRLLAIKMGRAGLRNAQRALETPEAAHLAEIYSAISLPRGLPVTKLTDDEASNCSLDAAGMTALIGEVKSYIDEKLGDKVVFPADIAFPEELYSNGEAANVLDEIFEKNGVPEERRF